MSVPNFNDINSHFNNPLDLPPNQGKPDSIIMNNPLPPPNHMPDNPRQIGDHADQARGGLQNALGKLVGVCRQIPMKWVKLMALGGIATGVGVIILIISASILGTGGAAIGALALFGLFGSLIVLAAGVSALTYGTTRGIYDAMTGEGQYEEHQGRNDQREIPQMRDLPQLNQANQGQNPGPIPLPNQGLEAAQGANPGPGAGAGQLEEEIRNNLTDRNIQQLPNDQTVPMPQPQPPNMDDLFSDLLPDVSVNPNANPQIQHLSQEILTQQQHLQDRLDPGPHYQAHRPRLDPVFLDGQNIIQISEEVEKEEEPPIEKIEKEPRIVEITEEEAWIEEILEPNIAKPAQVLNSDNLKDHLQKLDQEELQLIIHILLQSFNKDYKERVEDKFNDRKNELEALNKVQIKFKKDNKMISLGLLDYFEQLSEKERKRWHKDVNQIYGNKKSKKT